MNESKKLEEKIFNCNQQSEIQDSHPLTSTFFGDNTNSNLEK